MRVLRNQLTGLVLCVLIGSVDNTPHAFAQPPQANVANQIKDAKDGLTVNEPKAFQGYSLVAPMNSTSTYLIDMEGRIVNEWKSEFTPGVSAYLLENGHLLRPGAERGFTPGGPGAGGRIQEFTWEGELVWDYSCGDSKLRPHHDICRLPNGNVLVVANDPKTKDEAIAAGRRPESVRSQLLPDCLLEIKPTGKTTGKIVWLFKYPGAGFGGPGGMGPGGPGFGPPRVEPGDVMPEFLQPMFGVTPEQKDSLAKLKDNLKPKLEKLLTEQQLGIFATPKSSPFNPGAGRAPRFGDVIPGFLFDELALTDTQQETLKEIQKDADQQLEKIWTDEQNNRFKEMEAMFAGGRPGGGFGPPGGPPGGFGPPGGRPPGPGFGPPGGPGGLGPGPAGPGGPRGIFRCYRYGADFVGLVGKDLKPGKKLDEVAATPPRPPAIRPPVEE